jgi:sedoheptulose-bisphosphatase
MSSGNILKENWTRSQVGIPDDVLPRDVLARIVEGDNAGSALGHLLNHILGAVRDIAGHVRSGTFSSVPVGSRNVFGDDQLDVDVKSDETIFAALHAAGSVHLAASEERPLEAHCGCTLPKGCGFSVVFDPLDGSSIIDANFSVGTIVGIFPGKGIVGRKGDEQCCSLMALFGPRVTIALAFNACASKSGNRFCVELAMLPTGWTITCPNFSISSNAKTFAPGNLRATADNPQYMALVQYFIQKQYTLRYSGGMVPDVYHILIKGQGIFTNVASSTSSAKLRLAFEAAPIALIIEAAGGSSCAYPSTAGTTAWPVSLLEVVIIDTNQRCGVAYGSTADVARFKEFMF